MDKKTMMMVAGLLVGGMAVHAADQTWDPDGNLVGDGGAGTWDLATGNWIAASPWVNGNNAIFGDSGANYTVDIANSGVTVGDLTYAGGNKIQFKSLSDGNVITVNPGGATWNTGGGEIEFFNDGNALNTLLAMTSGDTLTVKGGGTFDTGQNPLNTGAGNWQVSGATLDIQNNTALLGNPASVGQFSLVKLGAGSSFIHERNANQTYTNNWEFGGGTVTFGNRWANNGHITVNGSISGSADEFVVDMASESRIVYLTQAAAYTAGTNRIAEGYVQLNADNGLSSSVLAIGGVASKNARFNMNGNDQTVKGVYHDTGNTREIRNNAAATISILTVDVDGGESYSYGGNIAGGGIINLVKEGAGSQTFSRNTGVGHTTPMGDVTVNNGELVWNVQGTGNTGAVSVGENGILGGTGIFNGAAIVAGKLNPGNSPGTMTFNGGLTLESTSTLTLEFVGTTAGEFDVLANDGGDTLTAGGMLTLDSTGYTAVLDDTFTVFENWSGFSGSFDSITGTDLGGGLSFDTSNLLVDGTITVVPEPATLGLIALMGVGTIWIRRLFKV